MTDENGEDVPVTEPPSNDPASERTRPPRCPAGRARPRGVRLRSSRAGISRRSRRAGIGRRGSSRTTEQPAWQQPTPAPPDATRLAAGPHSPTPAHLATPRQRAGHPKRVAPAVAAVAAVGTTGTADCGVPRPNRRRNRRTRPGARSPRSPIVILILVSGSVGAVISAAVHDNNNTSTSSTAPFPSGSGSNPFGSNPVTPNTTPSTRHQHDRGQGQPSRSWTSTRPSKRRTEAGRPPEPAWSSRRPVRCSRTTT